MKHLSREQIIEAARIAAERRGVNALSRSDFERLTGISQYHIYRLFPDGGWSEVSNLAGLESHQNAPITDDELLAEFHRVAASLGRIPTWQIFAGRANVSADVVRRRFGGLQGTLERYQEWLKAYDPSSPMLALLQSEPRHEMSSPHTPSHHGIRVRTMQWNKTEGIEYGAPISFRGLRHAPINEQGVVYLFGMVSYELGFLVEAIHTSFPDCDAKRCIDQRANRWERVRIEFEYRSRNFKDHGHDPASCDVIVCWLHDWNDCPVEVIELSELIGDLNG